ncbi:MAG TPA: cytochrome b/b6 domain-containing protein [Vicinamibacteria bacterium]|nr:cytochrome b/b6 domain-containing protein [Vicinamibacteria bacterium]
MSPLALALLVALAGPAPTNEDCLACHSDPELRSSAGARLFVDAQAFGRGVHGAFGCADCHAGISELPHPEGLPKVDCASCHDDVGREYAESVHGLAAKAGSGDAASCRSCHGPVHDVVPRGDRGSKVNKRNLPATCGACHADPEFLVHHRIPFAKPVEAYRLSVHGRAVERGDPKAASCSDCHGSHGIQPARSPQSKINHFRVATTCGSCHGQIAATFGDSVHGQAVKAGARDAPVCTDCHGEHTILAPSEAGSLVNPARVSSATCGHCHGDERLTDRYNLPKDKVPAFADSFHGLAGRAGSQTVANCASCHGVHNILPSRDPRSTVHPANLAKTCGACHPGAGQRFAIGPVHVTRATETEHALVRFVRVAYLILIPATLGFMLLHNALDFLRKLVRGPRSHASGLSLPRMNLHFRVAHWLVMLSFPTLVVTGFALKYPEAFWAAPLVAFEEDLAFRGSVHRIAAVLLCAACLYHVVHLLAVRRDRRVLRRLLPRARDAGDVAAFFRWALGRRSRRPSFGVFSYAEKMEYWAFVWGTAVMAVSGFLLWFENWSLAFFPTWVTDAATAIHWYEAILATLAILVWHLYLVIFDPDVYPMDLAWLSGRASADHLRALRPAYDRLLRRQGSGDSGEEG